MRHLYDFLIFYIAIESSHICRGYTKRPLLRAEMDSIGIYYVYSCNWMPMSGYNL